MCILSSDADTLLTLVFTSLHEDQTPAGKVTFYGCTTIPYDFTLRYAGGFLPMQIFLGTDCLYTFAVAVFFKN